MVINGKTEIGVATIQVMLFYSWTSKSLNCQRFHFWVEGKQLWTHLDATLFGRAVAGSPLQNAIEDNFRRKVVQKPELPYVVRF